MSRDRGDYSQVHIALLVLVVLSTVIAIGIICLDTRGRVVDLQFQLDRLEYELTK